MNEYVAHYFQRLPDIIKRKTSVPRFKDFHWNSSCPTFGNFSNNRCVVWLFKLDWYFWIFLLLFFFHELDIEASAVKGFTSNMLILEMLVELHVFFGSWIWLLLPKKDNFKLVDFSLSKTASGIKELILINSIFNLFSLVNFFSLLNSYLLFNSYPQFLFYKKCAFTAV